MPFGQVYVAPRRTQVRVAHQFRQTEYVYAGFDGTRSVGVPKIIETKWRLNPALLHCFQMRRFELRHRSGPVVSISDPARKQILAFRVGEPAVENEKRSRRDCNIANRPIGLPLPDMNVRSRRLNTHVLAAKLKDLTGT